RLNTQYLYLKAVFDYPEFVPPVVNVAHVSKVIDVAAGTGVWALDFVSQPEVRDRDVQVFACDISTAKFPQADKPDVDRITFFLHDVTKPFPDEMLGTFDLVHMAIMCWALTVQGWNSALQNIHDLLRPGGHLILRECDPLAFTHEIPPPLEGYEADIVTYTQGKSALATINRIYSGLALRQGLITNLSYHLRKMLQDSSFQILLSMRARAPYGGYCTSHNGLNGTPLSEFTAFTTQNISQVTDVATSAMMKAGCLESSDGIRVTDEEGRQALVKELRDFTEGGFLLILSEWVVVRPLGS
ncbi:S-adenosyl-L-methionine-dependent methyltransferase, partial [Lactarius indigo]